MSFSTITFVLDLFILRPWFSLSSANFCSICCCSCGVLAHVVGRLSSYLWFLKSVAGICFRVLPWTAWAVWYLPVVLLSWCWYCCFLSVGGLSQSCWYRFPSGVRCTHLLPPVLEARSVLLEFALIRRLSHIRRMRCRVGYYESSLFSFRRMSSLTISLVLSWVLYRCLTADISVRFFFYLHFWKLSSF